MKKKFYIFFIFWLSVNLYGQTQKLSEMTADQRKTKVIQIARQALDEELETFLSYVTGIDFSIAPTSKYYAYPWQV